MAREKSLKPTFSFEGTVRKARGATMASVPVDDRTIVVRIDQILEAPDTLLPFQGHDVTVQLSGRQKVKPGQKMVFQTIGWMFGDGLAVRAVSAMPAHARAAVLLKREGDPAQHRAATVTKERFDAANVVVSGRVVAVKLPADAPARRAPGRRKAGAEIATMHRPVSEHDPKWREAVVSVDDVHKGEKRKRQIIVRFPASRDVKWFKAPKFRSGEQGVFLLRKAKALPTRKSKGGRAAVAPAAGAEVFTALHPEDFHPLNRAERIRSVIALAETRQKKSRARKSQTTVRRGTRPARNRAKRKS